MCRSIGLLKRDTTPTPNAACVEIGAVGTISTEKPKFLTSLLIKYQSENSLTFRVADVFKGRGQIDDMCNA